MSGPLTGGTWTKWFLVDYFSQDTPDLDMGAVSHLLSSQPPIHIMTCPALGAKETHIRCRKMVVRVSQ